MVAVVTGNGLGLERSSAFVLGSRGQVGTPGLGRANDNVYVNAANGNLVIQNQDEMLIGLGPDDIIARTYNSQGTFTDDNGDNWRPSVARTVYGLTGTLNSAGSTVTRTDWDGSEAVYTWDGTKSAYVSKEGAGAYDTLTFSGTTWTWTDGNSRVTELYDNANGGRITSSADTDGNALTFTYGSNGLISRVTTADGNYTDLTYSGTLLTQVVTHYQTTSGGAFSTETRVRYGYDASNRLSTVTVDESPTDNAITDGNTYVTTYTYDGTSTRVASITQTDGSRLDVGYTLVGTAYYVSSLTQTISSGVTAATTFSYDTSNRVTTITDPQGQLTKLTYDAKGQLTRLELPAADAGAATQVFTYTYNTNGDVLTAKDASGKTTTYTYDANGNLTKSQDGAGNAVTYTYDANNQLLTETHYTVTGTNATPAVTADSLVVPAIGDSITFNPRANDADPDGDPLTITAVSTPTHGTATINAAGTITYARTSAGSDSFTYSVSDGQGHTATATVTVADSADISNVAPVATNDSITLDVVGASLTFDPRADDTDTDGDQLLITAVSTPTYGTATITNGGQAITYTRSAAGTDSFTYTISDQHGHTATATITVNSSNAAPVATNDTETALYVGSVLTFDPRANDTDFDSDARTVTAVSTASHGSVTISGGKIVYTRTSVGQDSFTYTLSDGQGHTDTATVTVKDYTAWSSTTPTATADTISIQGLGNSLTFDARANDTDSSGDPLTITGVSSATHGTVAIGNGGTAITYTRMTNGNDSFTYTISDGDGHTATATVTVQDPALATNSGPTANEDMVIYTPNVPVTFNPRFNDTDPDGDVLQITSVGTSMYGTATITNGGSSITYTSMYGGYDRIFYTVSDGQGHTATSDFIAYATTGSNTNVVAQDDQLVVGTSVIYDPRANDGDLAMGALTITAVSAPAHGTATIVNGGTAIRYVRTSIGTDSFTYTIATGSTTATATITVTDPPAVTNVAPTARGETIYANAVGDVFSFNPRLNDTDLNADTLTITAVSTCTVGTVAITGSGTGVTFTRTAAGAGSFTYTISDGHGHTSTATVTVQDSSATSNTAPTAAADTAIVANGSSLTFDPRANDTDPEGDALTITAVSAPSHGTATIVGGTAITYSRTSSGTDSFTYTISDGHGHTTTATVTVSEPVVSNQAPVAVNDGIVVNAIGDAITFDARYNDADFDADTLTITAVSAPGHGTATIVGGTQITYTRTSAGADSFTYTISDSHGHTDIATVNVTGSATPPSVTNPAMTTRYVYDAENHLRFVVSAEGDVTEHVYDAQGRRMSSIDYVDNTYDISGLSPSTSISESALASWAAGLSDKSTIQRTDYTYDFRGNIATETRFGQASSAGVGDTTAEYSTLIYVYDQSGQLKSRQWSGATRTESFVYDGLGRVISSTDFNSATTSVSFNDAGTTTVVTLSNGLTQTSIYDKLGELLSYAEAGSGVTTATKTYKYDAMGNLRIATDATGVSTYYLYDYVGRKIAEIDADGSLVEFKYNANNQLIATVQYNNTLTSTQLASLVDANGNPTSVQLSSVRPASDAADRWEWRIYDAAYRLVQTIDAAGAVTSYAYDGASRLISTTARANLVAAATLATFQTTPPTTSVSVTANSNADRVTRNFYDNNGRLVGTLDGEGYLTQILYDGAGRKTQSVAYATVTVSSHRASGSFATLLADVTATTNAGDIHNWFVYDDRGFLRASVDGEGDLTRYHYTAQGYLDQEIRGQQLDPSALLTTPPTLANLPAAPAGTVLDTTAWTRNLYGQALTETRTLASGSETVTYTYDAQRRLTKTVTTGTGVDSRTETQRYDGRGRLAGTLSGEGSAALAALGASPTQAQIDNIYATYGTTYVYDAADRLTQKIEPDGTGAAGRKTLYYYNTDGQLTHTVNALGEVVEYRYNTFGQRTDTITYNSRIASGTLATLTGGLVNTTLTNAVAAIANSAADTQIHLDYNVTGTVSQSTDALSNAATYSYNAFGEVIDRIQPLDVGVTVESTYGYDRRGLLLNSAQDVASGGLNLTTASLYDAFGRVTRTTDASGTYRYFDYDRAGQVVTTTDGLGQTTSFTYDGRGNTLTRTDRNGKTTTFAYTAFDRQVTMTTPEGVVTTTKTSAYGQTLTITDGANHTTTYTYDKDGNLKTVADSAGTTTNTYDNADRLALVTDAIGNQVSYTYDAANRVIARTIDPNGLNLTTSYSYDGKGQQVGITDANGVVTTIGFDKKGEKTSVIVDAGTGKLNLTTIYDYDEASRVQTVTEGYGTSAARVTSYTYDPVNRLIKTQVDPSGLNLTTTYTYDKDSNVVAKTDAANAVTRYVYDAENRLVYSVDAVGEVTAFSYDGEGRVTKTLAYANQVASATLAGWPLTITAAQVTAAVTTSSNDRITRERYDDDGRKAYDIDAEGYVTAYDYNGSNQVLKKIRYAVAYTVTDSMTADDVATLIGTRYPTTAVQNSYTYDTAGRLTSTYDGLGLRTFYTLNAIGQATQITVAYGTADASTIQRVYDSAGRIQSETAAYGQPEATTTSYTYDGLGHVLTTTDGDGYVTTRTYDNAGRLLTVTVPLDATHTAVTTNQYDAVGNLVKVTDPRGNAGYFYYDDAGRMTLQVDPERYATATTYSVGGQATSVTRYVTKTTGAAVGTPPTITTNANDATTTITRDKLDRITATTDAEGYTESYTLNAFGDRVTVTGKSSNASVSGPRGVTTNTYDDRGLLLQESKAVTWTDASGTARSTTIVNKYSYDGRRNRTQMIEAYGAAEARTTNYVYDKNDRLTQKTGDAVTVTNQTTLATSTVTPTETYTYDNRGNLTRIMDAAGAKTFFYYDDNNRKIAQVDALGTLSTWGYDDNGNVTSARVYGDAVALPASPGGTAPSPVNGSNYRETTYVYDRNNKLTTTTVAALRTGSYSGSSYTTSIGNVVSTQVYDAAGNVVQQTDGAGNSTYFYYDKRGRLQAQIDPEKYMTFYTRDAEGNVTKEERFANAVTAAITTTANPTSLRPAANATDDRVTNFTYDSNGRRLTETRTGVAAWTVDATTGALSAASTSATVTYSYNGLGEVLQKVEANGDTTDYTYDNFGRQTIEKDAAFADYQGTNVRLLTENSYDGLNNLTQTREAKSTGATIVYSPTNDRITTYTYGAGGRLATITDAAGFQRTYGYDAAGRVVKAQYSRVKSDATSVTEADTWQYDLLGRVTQQAKASYASAWSFGDKTQTQYDVYGEVTAKGLNGLTQETYDYDRGGRMWRSTAGDGTVKLYYYDKAGRVTLTVGTSGRDNSAETIESMYTLLSGSGAHAMGSADVSGVAVTFTTYDNRGLQLSTREPFRQLSVDSSGVYTTATIAHSRTYNAFGEVLSETDGRGYTTSYLYNTMGRLRQKTSPTVSVTSEAGVASNVAPIETYYYDLSGRLVGVKDANNYTTTRQLLAGTGHDKDEDPKVAKEFHPDGGIYTTGYDVFGDVRKLTNEIGNVELRDYDKMGRLTTLTRSNRAGNSSYSIAAQTGLVEYYTYDGLDQRLSHWNSQLGSTVKDTTDYDMQGRVTRSVDMGGNTTTYSYAWSGSTATTGLGTFGGWTKTTTNPAALTSSTTTDYFGRVVDRTDFGGHNYDFTFDVAGRQVHQTISTGGDETYEYLNTGKLASITDLQSSFTMPYYNITYTMTSTLKSNYSYDASGNRAAQSETLVTVNDQYDSYTGQHTVTQSTTSYQDATATYDALNRLTSFTDSGYQATTPATISYKYDAVGNVRQIYTTYEDAATETTSTQNYWYRYDAMNRFVVTKGTLSSGVIGRGTTGVDITYDLAGQRKTAINGSDGTKETYTYTEDGYLSYTLIAPTPTGTSVLRAKNLRDQMGRMTEYYEYLSNGTLTYSRYNVIYNNKSELLQYDSYDQGFDSGSTYMYNTYYYDYKADSNGDGDFTDATDQYQGGAVTHERRTQHRYYDYGANDTWDPDINTTTVYAWWDDAKQASITRDGQTTTVNYDTSGRITSANIGGGSARTVSYT
ncbi:MAG: Ig-like domain-containing protein, partial [Parcubacteria group bacterium]